MAPAHLSGASASASTITSTSGTSVGWIELVAGVLTQTASGEEVEEGFLGGGGGGKMEEEKK